MNDPTLVVTLGVMHKADRWHLTKWERLPFDGSIPLNVKYRCRRCGQRKRMSLW